MHKDVDGAVDRMFDLAVVLGDLMNRRLAERGMTPARAEVVWLLHRDGPRTQRELSQALKCSPRNVTGLVDALESAEFVVRKAHPTDRRAILVTLTGQGESLADLWHIDRDQSSRQLFDDISAADLATFVTVLDHILVQLRHDYENQ